MLDGGGATSTGITFTGSNTAQAQTALIAVFKNAAGGTDATVTMGSALSVTAAQAAAADHEPDQPRLRRHRDGPGRRGRVLGQPRERAGIGGHDVRDLDGAVTTKFYLHDATTGNTGTLPTDEHSSLTSNASATPPATNKTQRTMDTTIGTSQASLAGTTQASTSAQAMLMGMWESTPLAAQTLPTGTWTLSYAQQEANANANYQVTFCLYVWRPSTGAMVGSALYDHAANGAEGGTSENAASFTTGSVTGVAVSAGDILVCEIWRASIAQGNATARVCTFYYDGTTEASASSCASFLFCNGGTISFQPETSPALELSGFTITGPASGDTIEWVRASVTEHQSDAAQAAATFELWDSSGPTQIGATQTGTASTSTSSVSTATFTGVTYSQLANLRVRVYGNANAGTSYVESVDAASLTVSYSPASATNATVTMGSALAVATARPAPAVTATSNATAAPATRAVATAQPLPAVTATSNAAVTMASALAVATAKPLPAVTVTSNAAATAAALAAATAQPLPAVSATSSATAAPATLAAATAQPAPVVRQDRVVTLATVAVVTAAPAPVVRQDQAAAPAALAVTTSAPTPAVRQDRTAAPATAAFSTGQPLVTVTTTGNATAAPATLAVATAQPAAAVSTTAGATATPAVLSVTAAQGTVTVTAVSNTTVTPATLAVTAAQPAVTVTTAAGATATPAALAVTASQPPVTVLAYPETSPALELSGFGAFSAIGASDTIEWVQVATTEYQSDSSMAACTFELWDYSGTPAQIGATQTGTASTSTGNVSAATFTGVTYGMLATLRVRVYGHSGTAAPGATESVDSAALTVSYSPSDAGGASAAPAVLPVTAAFPAVTVTVPARPAVLAVTTAQPAPSVSTSGNATVTPAVLAVATSVPFSAAGSSVSITLIADDAITAPAAFPAVTVTTAAGATATPAALAVTTAQPGVTVTAGTGTAAAPATLAAASSIPAPVVRQDQNAAPAVKAATTTIPAPAVTAGGSATTAPATVAVTTSQPPPRLSARTRPSP